MWPFKTIDKSKPDWQKERSEAFNTICEIGRAVGRKIGKTFGGIARKIIPIAKAIAKGIAKWGPEAVLIAYGLIKQYAGVQGLSGPERMNKVSEGMKEFFEAKKREIPSMLRSGLQVLYEDLVSRKEI